MTNRERAIDDASGMAFEISRRQHKNCLSIIQVYSDGSITMHEDVSISYSPQVMAGTAKIVYTCGTSGVICNCDSCVNGEYQGCDDDCSGSEECMNNIDDLPDGFFDDEKESN